MGKIRWFLALIINTWEIKLIMSLIFMTDLATVIVVLWSLIKIRICLIVQYLNIVFNLEMLIFNLHFFF